MSDLRALSSQQSVVADQAAAWFARQRANPLTAAEAAEFSAWLKADPAHTAAWGHYQALWARMESVRDDPKVLAMRESARRSAERRVASRCRWRVASAVAASGLIAVGAWWGLQRGHGFTVVSAPAVRTSSPVILFDAPIRNASTAVGEHSSLLLADGSKVTLNTASAVRADFSGDERRVTLIRGEAFFEVAKDPTRPFVVSAGSRSVIAVGTAFNVRLQAQRVKVVLVEGKVRVTRRSDMDGAANGVLIKPVVLEAGSALVTGTDGFDHVERVNAERSTSWRTGKLVFDGERLADVLAEMNRYSEQKLEIADPALENRRVSGVFTPAGGPAFAKALEAYGIARASPPQGLTIALHSLSTKQPQ